MFSQATITQVYPPSWDGTSLTFAWQSSSPDGTLFQVYLNRSLAWCGSQRQVALPWPTELVNIAVGTVGPSECGTNFSSSLPLDPLNRAELTWEGGTFLDPDIAGFHIYQSTANGPVSFSAFVANIVAYPGSIITDGWNLGGWNDGGWGEAASYYSWISEPLSPSGTYTFSIAAYDMAGNESAGTTVTVTIAIPPATPPAFPRTMKCLLYSYNVSTHDVTLNWLQTAG